MRVPIQLFACVFVCVFLCVCVCIHVYDDLNLHHVQGKLQHMVALKDANVCAWAQEEERERLSREMMRYQEEMEVRVYVCMYACVCVCEWQLERQEQREDATRMEEMEGVENPFESV